MRRRVQRQMQTARRKGITPMEMLQMQETARREAERMELRAAKNAFFYALAVPCNVLANDFWPKSAKKKMPKFIDECLKLFEVVQEDTVSKDELFKLLEEYSGIRLDEVIAEEDAKEVERLGMK